MTSTVNAIVTKVFVGNCLGKTQPEYPAPFSPAVEQLPVVPAAVALMTVKEGDVFQSTSNELAVELPVLVIFA